MLQNQIRILQNIKKYNISALISTYQTVDCYILVLEKGSGGHLLNYIQLKSSQYGDKMLKQTFKQLFEILKVLHSAGFIHLDVKPENIICKESEHPSIFLCDYSISIHQNQATHQKNRHSITGTIGYISPEIINQEQFDHKSDIFSAGCSLFYLLTGKKLFGSKSIIQTRQLTQDSKYIQKKVCSAKGLTQSAKDLLFRLLEVEQQKRISASEALQHEYFKDCEKYFSNIGKQDDTLAKFLERKILSFVK